MRKPTGPKKASLLDTLKATSTFFVDPDVSFCFMIDWFFMVFHMFEFISFLGAPTIFWVGRLELALGECGTFAAAATRPGAVKRIFFSNFDCGVTVCFC